MRATSVFFSALQQLNWSRADSTIRATLPDVVAEAGEAFGGNSSNRYDVQKRDRIPLSMYSMELEWRNNPIPMFKRLLLTNMKLATWLFWSFCLSTLLVAPLLRLFGGAFLSPVTYPLISFISGLA